MVDFRKRLSQPVIERPKNPILIYDKLDRASDKGPLRPAQRAILEEWFENHRNDKDLILKLHTGEGKTLIGLLMLQSFLNDGAGPAMYVCPNEQLVLQTLEQAAQFGVPAIAAGSGLPAEFETSRKILVVNVQTVFNGKTRFGLDAKSIPMGAICLDDAHACVDSIRNAFTIRLTADEPAYRELRDLFATDLREQGQGTFVDIEQGDAASILPVPYWACANTPRLLLKSSRSTKTRPTRSDFRGTSCATS